MLEVLLFILKLIGIILLVIVTLLLLIIFVVLFAPVKYKSKGVKNDEALDVIAWITYLNPIVRVTVHYPDEDIVQVKLLGYTIYPSKTKKTETIVSKEEGSYEVPKEETKASDTVENAASDKEAAKKAAPPKFKEGNDENGGNSQAAIQAETISTKKPQDSESEQEQGSTKDSTLDTIGYYASLLQENKTLILDVLKTVLKTFKTILPRKCYIRAVFGTGKADITGQLYGLYCGLIDLLPGEINFEPVWTEKYLAGEYELKGKIRLIHFVLAAIKIIMNKEVRLLIKKLRRV